MVFPAVGHGLVPQPHGWQAPYRQQGQTPYAQMASTGDYAVLQNTAMGMFNGMVSSTKQSPLGMELGEFMLDGDLEFLSSHSFAYNRGVAP